jgi:hypothetical protein
MVSGPASRTFITCVKAASKTRRPYLPYMLFDERDQSRHPLCAARSSVAAASAAAVSPPSVMSPRSAHLRIFLAIRRRTRCSSAPIERPLHARSRATSILASVRESKLSAIMTVFFIEVQQSLQARVWQVFHASQKICPAAPRHCAECPLASLPHFARGQAASCAPVPAPPALRLPDQASAAGFCSVGAWSRKYVR